MCYVCDIRKELAELGIQKLPQKLDAFLYVINTQFDIVQLCLEGKVSDEQAGPALHRILQTFDLLRAGSDEAFREREDMAVMLKQLGVLDEDQSTPDASKLH